MFFPGRRSWIDLTRSQHALVPDAYASLLWGSWRSVHESSAEPPATNIRLGAWPDAPKGAWLTPPPFFLPQTWTQLKGDPSSWAMSWFDLQYGADVSDVSDTVPAETCSMSCFRQGTGRYGHHRPIHLQGLPRQDRSGRHIHAESRPLSQPPQPIRRPLVRAQVGEPE